jgi:tetratricopeptide (TPR) repeat protein
LVIAGTIALVLGPLLYAWIPAEISRWYEASAIEKHLDGDSEGAIKDLGQALRWNPENSSVYHRRAGWKLDDGDYLGALEDCHRALELAPDDSQVYMQRSLALQHLGRHQEAIADWNKLVEIHENDSAGARATTLNGLAYALAVGNRAGAVGKTELDEALENIQRALELVDENAAMLDTRGFIHYLRGDMDAAKRDMDAAVAQMEALLSKAEESTRFADRRDFELQLEEVRQSVAVIRYHRALVNEKVGDAELAEQDRQRVRELGYEATDSLF